MLLLLPLSAHAEDLIFDCVDAEWKLKVEKPLIGKNKLYHRGDGSWTGICLRSNDIISNDGFKCFFPIGNAIDYFVFDVMFQTLKYYKNNKQVQNVSCYKRD